MLTDRGDQVDVRQPKCSRMDLSAEEISQRASPVFDAEGSSPRRLSGVTPRFVPKSYAKRPGATT